MHRGTCIAHHAHATPCTCTCNTCDTRPARRGSSTALRRTQNERGACERGPATHLVERVVQRRVWLGDGPLCRAHVLKAVLSDELVHARSDLARRDQGVVVGGAASGPHSSSSRWAAVSASVTDAPSPSPLACKRISVVHASVQQPLRRVPRRALRRAAIARAAASTAVESSSSAWMARVYAERASVGRRSRSASRARSSHMRCGAGGSAQSATAAAAAAPAAAVPPAAIALPPAVLPLPS